jgi:hypothetical protein
MQAKHLALIVLAAASLSVAGCHKKETPPPPPAPVILPPPPPPPAAVAVAPKDKAVYVYSGDRFRDPFVPSGFTGGYSADAVFDPTKTTVKGIVFGPGQRTAVLATGSGNTYFVKSGKIFDVMGKTIDGFTAQVMVDRVIVTNDSDAKFELKIRNEEEKSL